MWKFQDFSITQILREINFDDSTSAKSAILTHLQVLNFEFYEFCTVLVLKFTKLTESRAPKRAKIAILEQSDSSTLISHKI